MLPTATLRPTEAPLPPTVTPEPADTRLPPASTPAPTVTVTATLPISTQATISATTGHVFQAPILLGPVPDAKLYSGVRFEWQWEGEPLPDDMAFDLLIWSEAENREHQGEGAFGVIDTERSQECDVDLDYVHTIMEHGEGNYYWTILVVRKDPYERVGEWGEKRSFTYVFPESPSKPTAQSP